VVKLAEDKGCELEELSPEELSEIDERLTADELAVVTVDASVNSRTSYGGTAPDNVRSQISSARARFLVKDGT
jgi:argininosuccinate lyase